MHYVIRVKIRIPTGSQICRLNEPNSRNGRSPKARSLAFPAAHRSRGGPGGSKDSSEGLLSVFGLECSVVKRTLNADFSLSSPGSLARGSPQPPPSASTLPLIGPRLPPSAPRGAEKEGGSCRDAAFDRESLLRVNEIKVVLRTFQ